MWNQNRNDATAVFSIDVKTLVQGQYFTLGMLFRHSNQTRIGQGHRSIRIAPDQFHEWLALLFQVEDGLNDSPVYQFENSLASSRQVTHKKTGFSQNCLTREERRTYSLPLLICPIVETVALVEKRDQGARIHNDGLVHVDYRPKPFRWILLTDRSVGPATVPAKS